MLLSSFKKTHPLIAGILILACLMSISWKGANTHHSNNNSYKKDTVPNQEKIKKDIDYHLQELQKAMSQLDEQLQGKNWEKAQKDIEESLKKIDMQKINQQLDEAIKKLDVEKIMKEAEQAINKVEFEKIQEQVKTAIKEAEKNVDLKEVEKELSKSMAELKKELEKSKQIDHEKLKKELQEAKKEIEKEKVELQRDMEKLKAELKREKIDMEKELTKAKQEISKAREELTMYKTMISEMEKDGLLKSEEDYTIQYKNGKLSINGKEQPKDITDKYRKYISKETLTIKSEKGNIEIN
jgi:hypothetical protein